MYILYCYLFLIDDNRETFRDSGGIECLIECYENRKELVKEVIFCLANAVRDDGKNHITYFIIIYLFSSLKKWQKQVLMFFSKMTL